MLTREQIKELKCQLSAFRYRNFYREAKRRFPVTAAERASHRTVKKFERQRQSYSARLERQADKLRGKVRHEMYFGTEKGAVKAIKALASFMAKAGR